MWNGSPLEMFLGLVAVSTRWQAMTGSTSPAEARGFIKGFGENGDAEIAAGSCVAFAKVASERLEMTGFPSSYTPTGDFILAIECPKDGPEGSYGSSLSGGRDFEDEFMAVWEDLRMLRYDVLTEANQAGTFCVRGFEIEDVTRSFYSRDRKRWRFHARILWGAVA